MPTVSRPRKVVPAVFQPATAATEHTTPARRRRPAAAAPVTLPKVDENTRPTEHNGVKIEREERIAIGPHGSGRLKISKLDLADGTTAYACWDCQFTGQGRGDIIVHRNKEHGTRSGKKIPRVVYDKPSVQADLFDVVLPPRPNGTAAPESAIDWTIGELLAVAPNLKALGDLIDRLEAECESLRTQLDARQVSRHDQHKIAVYDALQQEVAELRLWKKNVIKKFGALGFKLEETNEEEQ